MIQHSSWTQTSLSLYSRSLSENHVQLYGYFWSRWPASIGLVQSVPYDRAKCRMTSFLLDQHILLAEPNLQIYYLHQPTLLVSSYTFRYLLLCLYLLIQNNKIILDYLISNSRVLREIPSGFDQIVYISDRRRSSVCLRIYFNSIQTRLWFESLMFITLYPFLYTFPHYLWNMTAIYLVSVVLPCKPLFYQSILILKIFNEVSS